MREQDQYIIDMLINCPKGHCEVMPNDVSSTECLVEELSAQVLTTFFDTVLIDDVSVKFTARDEAPIAITLRAQGIEPLYTGKNLDITIEEKLTCALAEIFSALHVERCTVL